jgi:hypothetical protein
MRQAQQLVEAWLWLKDGSVRELSDGLAYAFDDTQAANGPSEARLTPELVALHVKAQLLGLEAVNSGHEFPDQWWWWARHVHLYGVTDFFTHQGRYAQETAGTPAAALYRMETIQQLCLSACQDLVMALGLGLLLGEEQARLPKMLDLDVWLKQVTSARISAHMEPSPLWLPNGMGSGTLHIGEEVAVGSPGGPH